MVTFNQTILKAVSGGIASYAGRTISILSFNSYKQRKKSAYDHLLSWGLMSSIKDIFNESNQAKVAEIAFCASRLLDEITDYKFEDTMQVPPSDQAIVDMFIKRWVKLAVLAP